LLAADYITFTKALGTLAPKAAALPRTALHCLFWCLQALLDNGANVHAREELALGLAAMFGRTDCVTMLLEHGADVHANQDLPLLLAAMCGHSNTVTVLERHGANWAHTPAPGMTRQWLKWMLRCGKVSKGNVTREFKFCSFCQM
jgi:hypothetical protein